MITGGKDRHCGEFILSSVCVQVFHDDGVLKLI